MNRTLKYALSAALSALIVVPALAQDNFPDVPESHWAYRDLLRMKQEGLLVGYPDGLFRGARPASRYELAVACHAVWANLKAVTDGLKSQIDDLNSKMAGMPSKSDMDDLRAKIDALQSQLDSIKNNDIPALRKMVDEFQTELTKLGADVDQMKKDLDDMKGKVGWLWQHRLPFDVSGDSNFWLGSGYSRDTATGGFGVTVDDRPTGVSRDGTFGLAGGTEDLTILHENALKIVSNNETGPTLKATMVFGNMMGSSNFLAASVPGTAFGNQSQVFPGIPFSESNDAWYFQELAVNFDTSFLGLGFNAELGRTGYKISPYIFQRPDTTPYFANERWDDGRWMFDGGVLGFKFGGARLNVIGGRNSGHFDTSFSELQPMFAGAAGNPFTPGFSTSRPRGFMRDNGFGAGGQAPGLSIDQSLGFHLSVPLSNTGALNLAYLWLDSNQPQGVIGTSSTANRVNVYGGDLKFNFSNIDVEGGYSKSDVMNGNHAVINKNNAAWYATLGYAASNWGIKGGYRRIDPQFGAPGDWGRIGIWWNPTDIKGWYADAHFDISKDLRLMANAGFYTGTGTSLTGGNGTGIGLSTDDHLNHASVGIGYKMGANHSLLLGYEGVWWDLSGSLGAGTPKPTEQWFNIGWGVDLSSRAKFNILWQISKYDSKGIAGMGPFPEAGIGGGQTTAEGGLITTQLTFRF
jgi:outer membrane murein-binding lipoprotein Lpp